LKRTSIFVHPDEWAEFMRIAEGDDLKAAQLMRRLMREHIAQHKALAAA
jgi:hypothetical protein